MRFFFLISCFGIKISGSASQRDCHTVVLTVQAVRAITSTPFLFWARATLVAVAACNSPALAHLWVSREFECSWHVSAYTCVSLQYSAPCSPVPVLTKPFLRSHSALRLSRPRLPAFCRLRVT